MDIWSYGAQVSQPIFTGGALRGNLRLAESEHEQALIAYRQAIQHAFGDVSDALIGYQKNHQVRVRQQRYRRGSAGVRPPVRHRYSGGTTTYLEVLDGQRSLFAAELTLAQARGTEYQSLVQLYRALGGGWQAIGYSACEAPLYARSDSAGARTFSLKMSLQEKQVCEQCAEMDRSIQVIDQLRADGRLGQHQLDGREGVAGVTVQDSEKCVVVFGRLEAFLVSPPSHQPPRVPESAATARLRYSRTCPPDWLPSSLASPCAA